MQRLHQFLHRVGIVGTIDNNCWVLADDFDTSRPVGSTEARTQLRLIPLYSLLPQHFEGSQGSSSVFQLMLTCEQYFEVCIGAFRRPDSEQLTTLGTLLQAIAVAERRQLSRLDLCLGCISFGRSNAYQVSMLLLANGSDGQQGLGRLCRGDDHAIWLNDASFLGGDLRQGVPKYLHMIVANGGNHGNQGLCHVGGIQSSSQANL